MISHENEETKNISSESRIDYHIRNTKKELKLETITAPYLNSEKTQQQPHHSSEFAFNSPQIPVVRRYMWLGMKLVALYLTKWFSWFAHRK
jgi:hypothetical protein